LARAAHDPGTVRGTEACPASDTPDHRAYVPPEQMIEYRSARDQTADASILNETETYLNIDGYLYDVVSLKELPDATFPGMLQNFSTLGFRSWSAARW